ncbi:MAG: DUF255 domain-containing protein, partial [Pseudomonadota bacterium]
MNANAATANSGAISWHHWSAEPFESAKELNKLIIVNVGYEGCTACRYMDENTFRDPRVIELLEKNFVSIQVDSEARPDIGERYSDWAWPATAFLHPDGRQIFAIRGSRRAAKFATMLENLIARQKSGQLQVDGRAPYGSPDDPVTEPLVEILAQVRRQLDRSFDDKRGGWGSNVKILEYPGPTLQLFMRAHLYADDQARSRALLTTAGFTQQTDSVWGGFFYASINSWTNTIKEKLLETQAAALRIFADALQISGEDIYRQSIAEVDRYLQSHMRSQSGLLFSSQKDLNADLKGIDSDAYYELDEKSRRAITEPRTDRATYTDLNARVANAYARAYQVTKIAEYEQRAREIMSVIIERRRQEAGWYVQIETATQDDLGQRAHVLTTAPRPFLRTQAYTGLALLRLYQITDDDAWLNAAKELAVAVLNHLEDKELGGFFATNSADNIDNYLKPRKPLEDNAAIAMFFHWLGVLEKNDDYLAKAEAIIRAVATPEVVKREGRITGNLAMALELLINGYVEMSVVGDREDPASKALFEAAHKAYEPRKVVHFEAPGRYPRREDPSLYVCN